MLSSDLFMRLHNNSGIRLRVTISAKGGDKRRTSKRKRDDEDYEVDDDAIGVTPPGCDASKDVTRVLNFGFLADDNRKCVAVGTFVPKSSAMRDSNLVEKGEIFPFLVVVESILTLIFLILIFECCCLSQGRNMQVNLGPPIVIWHVAWFFIMFTEMT